MPTEIRNIDKFEGGLNNASDPKDINENQVADTEGFDFSKNGRAQKMGHCELDATVNSTIGVIQPGYGLYTFFAGYNFVAPTTGGTTISITENTAASDLAQAKCRFNVVGAYNAQGQHNSNVSDWNDWASGNDAYIDIQVNTGSGFSTIITADEPTADKADAGKFFFYKSDGSPDPFGLHEYSSATFNNSTNIQNWYDDLVDNINAGTSSGLSHGMVAVDLGIQGVRIKNNTAGSAGNDPIKVTFTTGSSGSLFERDNMEIGNYTNNNNDWGTNFNFGLLEAGATTTTGPTATTHTKQVTMNSGADNVQQVQYITLSGSPSVGEVIKLRFQVGSADHTITHTVTSGNSSISTVTQSLITAITAAYGGGQPLENLITAGTYDADNNNRIIITSAVTGTAGEASISAYTKAGTLAAADTEIIALCDKYGYLTLYDATDSKTWNPEFADLGWKGNIVKPIMFAENGLLRLIDSSFEDQIIDDTCVCTASSATITMTSTAGIDAGMTVTGEGIPASATVSSVDNSTTFTLSSSSVSGSKIATGLSEVLDALQISALGDALASDNNSFDFATGTTDLTGSNKFTAANGATFVNASTKGKLTNGSDLQGYVSLPFKTVVGQIYDVEFDTGTVSSATVNVSLGATAAFSSGNSSGEQGASQTDVNLGTPWTATGTTSYCVIRLSSSTTGHYVNLDDFKIGRRTRDLTFGFTNENKILGPVYKPGLFGGTRDISAYVLDANTLAGPVASTSNSSTTAGSPTVYYRGHSNLVDTDTQVNFKLQREGNTGDGNWVGTYKFYVSCVYDDGQESLPSLVLDMADDGTETFSFEEADSHNEKKLRLSIQAHHGADGLATYAFPYRQTGFRLYWSESIDGYGEKWLLGTLDFREGFIRSDGGLTVPWAEGGSSSPHVVIASSGSSAETMDFVSPAELESFEYINGYSHKNTSLSARFKAHTFTARRAFIGNVKYGTSGNEIVYNDRLIISPPNQVDIFPTPYNVIDVDISDGDAIVALEAFDDYLLEFKNKHTYLINIGSGDPTTYYLEKTLRFLGVSTHNAVCETPYGIFWVNYKGAYIFNGDASNIKYLNYYEGEGGDKSNQRITESTWSDFGAGGSNIMCGYDPSSDSVVIKKSCVGTTTSGAVIVYSFRNDSFTKSSANAGDGYFIDNKDTTNFIQKADGTLYLGKTGPKGTTPGEDGGTPT